jgi:hypothetical protein
MFIRNAMKRDRQNEGSVGSWAITQHSDCAAISPMRYAFSRVFKVENGRVQPPAVNTYIETQEQ